MSMMFAVYRRVIQLETTESGTKAEQDSMELA